MPVTRNSHVEHSTVASIEEIIEFTLIVKTIEVGGLVESGTTVANTQITLDVLGRQNQQFLPKHLKYRKGKNWYGK